MKRFMERDDIFRFCLVRNPYTRLLSAYLDKIAKNTPTKLNILHHLGLTEQAMDEPIDFPLFVDVACGQSPEHMDPHWRVQYIHTCQAHIEYHKIGRFETLDEDFRSILNILSPNAASYLSTEQRHSTRSEHKLRDYYTPELRAKVRQAYALDFEHFGYPDQLP